MIDILNVAKPNIKANKTENYKVTLKLSFQEDVSEIILLSVRTYLNRLFRVL